MVVISCSSCFMLYNVALVSKLLFGCITYLKIRVMLILVVISCVHVSFLSFDDVCLACFVLVRLDWIVFMQ